VVLTLVGAYLLLPAASAAHDTSESDAQQRGVQYPGELEGTGRVELLDRGKLTDRQAPFALNAMGPTPCVGGFAGIYPCRDVDLLAFLPLAEIGGGHGNDVWGWTDPLAGREYALMGRTTGTSFVDISDPSDPFYLGDLPAQPRAPSGAGSRCSRTTPSSSARRAATACRSSTSLRCAAWRRPP
jgi:hypothetical protein